jgi:sporulation protein YlmC with PRC-barrel domain
MKKSFITYGLACAASMALATSTLAASADSPGASGSSSGSYGVGSAGSSSSGLSGSESSKQSRETDSSISGLSSDTNSWSSSRLSATGRTSQQAIRGSKLIGAQVKDASGSSIGKIEDVILNPSSGKIDFAVISRSGQGASSSPSGTSTGAAGSAGAHSQNTGTGQGMNTGTTYESGAQGGTTSGLAGGKLIPVPWSLLQPASGSAGSEQQSFTLAASSSKLDSAPSITSGTWAEIGQSDWSQRVNSHFGVSQSSSMGGAESPSGLSTGTDSSIDSSIDADATGGSSSKTDQ